MTMTTINLEASEPVGSRRDAAAWASPTQGGIAEAQHLDIRPLQPVAPVRQAAGRCGK